MTTSNEKAISALNDLIAICKDGTMGFASAAEGVQDSSFRSLFQQYSQERSRFASELQREVQKLGGKPQGSGSTAGALHRGWIGLKTALTGKNDHAVLVECERAEDAAKETYEKAISGMEVPGTILPIVQRQYASVQAAHDRVKALRDTVTV